MPCKSLGLPPSLVRATQDLEYKEPTPVQAGAIPPALAGGDGSANAPTAPGKARRVPLPAAQRPPGLPRPTALPRGVPRALVLSPTRELAEQIADVCRDLARHTKVQS